MTCFKIQSIAIQRALAALSIAAVIGFFGCAKKAADSKVAADGHEHAHAEEGPHHGQLIELGEEEYHGELVHDDAAGKVTIYVLDNKAAANVPIEAAEIMINIMVGPKPTQFTLKAAPDTGDPSGKSSRFELADKTLSDALDAEGPGGHLNLTIGGKPYVGKIEHHHQHDHHDHEKK